MSSTSWAFVIGLVVGLLLSLLPLSVVWLEYKKMQRALFRMVNTAPNEEARRKLIEVAQEGK